MEQNPIPYPQKWLLVEALEAHSEAGKCLVEDLAVVEDFADSAEAMRRYMQLHDEAPSRELYVIHTSREEIDIIKTQPLIF